MSMKQPSAAGMFAATLAKSSGRRSKTALSENASGSGTEYQDRTKDLASSTSTSSAIVLRYFSTFFPLSSSSCDIPHIVYCVGGSGTNRLHHVAIETK